MKPDSQLARRKFLKMASLTAAGLSFGFPPLHAKNQPARGFPATDPRFMPVNVAADRVIRTVVGLRPYRPSGFVVRSEKLGKKTIIHNYGHGGAGVTLSWGTGKLAVDLALQTNQKNFAVIGCGVIGLTTARLLQRKGFNVTIYASKLPPETTSNVAGALWFPTTVYDQSKVDSQFLSQFELACRISHRAFQDYVGSDYGVRWIKDYTLGQESENFPVSRDLYPEIRDHRDSKIYFGYDYVQSYGTMMIEPPVYLNALLRDFYLAGGKLQVREFSSMKDIDSLNEKVIMNCTGLGARTLFNDEELIPVRGQLTVLIPQPEIDYCYYLPGEKDFLYMFPRKDGIILGGTFEYGNWSIEPSAAEQDRVLKGHAAVAKKLSQ